MDSSAEIESLTRELERAETHKSQLEQKVAELDEAKDKLTKEVAECTRSKNEVFTFFCSFIHA